MALLLIEGVVIRVLSPLNGVLVALPFFVGLVFLAAFARAVYRHKTFRCPRCGERFFVATFWNNPLARRCVHCGLPKYAAP